MASCRAPAPWPILEARHRVSQHQPRGERLREDRANQLQLFDKIIKERLNVPMARFWCNQLLTPADKRLDRRIYDRIEKRFLAQPALREAFADGELEMSPSVQGEKLDLEFEDAADLRRKLKAMLAALKGL